MASPACASVRHMEPTEVSAEASGNAEKTEAAGHAGGAGETDTESTDAADGAGSAAAAVAGAIAAGAAGLGKATARSAKACAADCGSSRAADGAAKAKLRRRLLLLRLPPRALRMFPPRSA